MRNYKCHPEWFFEEKLYRRIDTEKINLQRRFLISKVNVLEGEVPQLRKLRIETLDALHINNLPLLLKQNHLPCEGRQMSFPLQGKCHEVTTCHGVASEVGCTQSGSEMISLTNLTSSPNSTNSTTPRSKII